MYKTSLPREGKEEKVVNLVTGAIDKKFHRTKKEAYSLPLHHHQHHSTRLYENTHPHNLSSFPPQAKDLGINVSA